MQRCSKLLKKNYLTAKNPQIEEIITKFFGKLQFFFFSNLGYSIPWAALKNRVKFYFLAKKFSELVVKFW